MEHPRIEGLQARPREDARAGAVDQEPCATITPAPGARFTLRARRRLRRLPGRGNVLAASQGSVHTKGAGPKHAKNGSSCLTDNRSTACSARRRSATSEDVFGPSTLPVNRPFGCPGGQEAVNRPFGRPGCQEAMNRPFGRPGRQGPVNRSFGRPGGREPVNQPFGPDRASSSPTPLPRHAAAVVRLHCPPARHGLDCINQLVNASACQLDSGVPEATTLSVRPGHRFLCWGGPPEGAAARLLIRRWRQWSGRMLKLVWRGSRMR